jgi:thioredoxin
MKKLGFISVLAIIVSFNYSCSTNSQKENNTDINNAAILATTENTIMEETKTIEKTTGKVVHLTTQEFKDKVFNYEVNKEWKYNGDKPAIIDFYADWCRPCKMVAPILEDLAKEYADDIVIYKVDTEAEQELAAAFGIRSIPSILFVPVNGQPQMAQGALPKESFKEAINDILLKK